MSGHVAAVLVPAGAIGREVVTVGGPRWERAVPAQDAPVTAREQAEQIRSDVRRSVHEQIDAAKAEAARAARETQGVPVPPAPPAPHAPQVITVDRNGRKIVITGDEGGPMMSGQRGPLVIDPHVPREAVDIALAFFLMLAFIAVGLPLARAFARRMDRHGVAGAGRLPSDVGERLERIEHAVEAVAIEVERISEGQRFTTRLLAEMRPDALPAAAPDRRS